MNLKLIVTTLGIAAVSVFAQVQGSRATNVIGEQMDQAEQRKDGKKTEELAKKLDEMSQKLGPEYAALAEALQDVDPNSTDGHEIRSTLVTLDKLCPK